MLNVTVVENMDIMQKIVTPRRKWKNVTIVENMDITQKIVMPRRKWKKMQI